jgi:hypothetical protein
MTAHKLTTADLEQLSREADRRHARTVPPQPTAEAMLQQLVGQVTALGSANGTRKLQLAPPISQEAPHVLLVTQGNCLAVAGLEPRKFLQVIHELDLTVYELGKTRAVRADELLAAVARKPRREREPEAESQTDRLARAAGLG